MEKSALEVEEPPRLSPHGDWGREREKWARELRPSVHPDPPPSCDTQLRLHEVVVVFGCSSPCPCSFLGRVGCYKGSRVPGAIRRPGELPTSPARCHAHMIPSTTPLTILARIGSAPMSCVRERGARSASATQTVAMSRREPKVREPVADLLSVCGRGPLNGLPPRVPHFPHRYTARDEGRAGWAPCATRGEREVGHGKLARWSPSDPDFLARSRHISSPPGAHANTLPWCVPCLPTPFTRAPERATRPPLARRDGLLRKLRVPLNACGKHIAPTCFRDHRPCASSSSSPSPRPRPPPPQLTSPRRLRSPTPPFCGPAASADPM
jgi:hypothetical protein